MGEGAMIHGAAPPSGIIFPQPDLAAHTQKTLEGFVWVSKPPHYRVAINVNLCFLCETICNKFETNNIWKQNGQVLPAVKFSFLSVHRVKY